MRKQLAVLLAAALLVTLAGCTSIRPTVQPVNQPTVEEPAATTQVPTKQATDTPTATSTGSGADVYFSTYAEVAAKLPQYYLTMKGLSDDQRETAELYIKGEVLISEMSPTSVTYVDYKKDKTWVLDTTDKTGSDWGSAGSGTGSNGGMILSILINYGLMQKVLIDDDILKVAKGGTEKIAGMTTTKYTYSFGGADVTFWLDSQYGLALKVTGTQSDWEVTSLKTSGFKAADLLDISQYTIS